MQLFYGNKGINAVLKSWSDQLVNKYNMPNPTEDYTSTHLGSILKIIFLIKRY